jgi:hypothetical protein
MNQLPKNTLMLSVLMLALSGCAGINTVFEGINTVFEGTTDT